MQTVYVTRRNLLTLLAKLDRAKAGEFTTRTLIKRDTVHPVYPCTDVIELIALEDEQYYTDREAGEIKPVDEETIKNNPTVAPANLAALNE